MTRVVVRSITDDEGVAEILRPRTDLLLERDLGDGRFEAASGPVTSYSRTVEVVRETAPGQDVAVTQTVDFRLAVPYFGWLFVLPFKHALRRPGGDRAPWWAPPARLDARAASVLGTLALLTVASGYLNTLFTQTVPFAGDEFGASNSALGVAGSVVRVGGLAALVVMVQADRRGRKAVLITAAAAGSLLALTGALAPSLPWLTASQMLARAFATTILLLVTIVAAEEMPAGSRAYAVSLLAMSSGLGAGVCVIGLRLADLGTRGWRLLYVIPLLGLPIVAAVRRRLPESRRFVAPHVAAPVAGHGGRLALLAVSGVLANLFVAPSSQFGNQYLRTERGFSGGRIGLLSVTIGTPAVIGIVAGGRIADVRGRRLVAAFALVFGTLCTITYFFSSGWEMWVVATLGTVISAAAIPALGVYGPELFPTGLRGRANGLVAVSSLLGSAAGLILCGVLSDSFGRIGPAMSILAAGPLLLAVLVLAAYPETAGKELEDLNPEDRPPPDPPLNGPLGPTV
ncbi:MAG TPA: MFS transporter [Acidimicrobiales bacterium]|nr:MFS transporter [Acidimicrobiales bacterium]